MRRKNTTPTPTPTGWTSCKSVGIRRSRQSCEPTPSSLRGLLGCLGPLNAHLLGTFRFCGGKHHAMMRQAVRERQVGGKDRGARQNSMRRGVGRGAGWRQATLPLTAGLTLVLYCRTAATSTTSAGPPRSSTNRSTGSDGDPAANLLPPVPPAPPPFHFGRCFNMTRAKGASNPSKGPHDG